MGKKRERESSQDEPALGKGERQLKSAKIEISWSKLREEKILSLAPVRPGCSLFLASFPSFSL